MKINTVQRNLVGVDFFVGDIHGEYQKLMDALCKVGFDFDKDRLWCVGDLVDRGPDSLKCLLLIDEPWFGTVLGNHESMMIDAVLRSEKMGDRERYYAKQMWATNGGEWYYALEDEYKLLADTFIKVLDEYIPNAILVGDIGVIHAECPTPLWLGLGEGKKPYLEEASMWSRSRMTNQSEALVLDVAAVVVGHTPVKQTTVLGNHVYIDGGACFYPERDLVVLSYDEILDLVNEGEV